MGHPVDVHVGTRIRQRRLLIGMTQQVLAARLGVTFQQVQKYEIGANRVSASRLWDIARLLDVPVGFFFEGIAPADQRDGRREARAARPSPVAEASAAGGSDAVLATLSPPARQELTLAAIVGPGDRDAATLLRAFCAIPPEQRRHLLDLALSLTQRNG
jgi:transcriptional regulator with XRE-family HTH domain